MTTPENLSESNGSPDFDEKKLLLDRARLMGLKVSPNIGLETLRTKVRAAQEADEKVSADQAGQEAEDETESAEEPSRQVASAPAASRKLTENERRREIQKEAMRLVRIRLTCLNPAKKDLHGGIFTVGNKYIGTVRKYVPYGDQTENGYHVPWCIYKHLKAAKFLNIQVKKVGAKGEETVRTSYVPEFAIEVLPQLTPKELRALAQRQAMAAGTANETESLE